MVATGYVHNLIDKNYTMKQFALHCARAFVCFDEDVEFATESIKGSNYYARQYEQAKKDLEDWEKMSASEREDLVGERHSEDIARLKDYIQEEERVNKILFDMSDEIVAWKVLPELDEFKTFLLEQIQVSVQDPSYAQKELYRFESYNINFLVSAYYIALVEDIEYFKEKAESEKRNNDTINEWLKALHDSLKGKE